VRIQRLCVHDDVRIDERKHEKPRAVDDSNTYLPTYRKRLRYYNIITPTGFVILNKLIKSLTNNLGDGGE